MVKRKTLNEVIQHFKKIHGNKYDYSKVEYKNNKTKVCIICPIHGEFWQTPLNHMQYHGCPKCAKSGVKPSEEEFIKRCKKIHNNKYDYSKVEYKNSHLKICITCKKHGDFFQFPYDHLNGCGCPKCANDIKGKYQNGNTEKFIEESKKINNNYYDYSKVEYVNNRIKVCIICPVHGEFWQTPKNHLKKNGCPKCNQSKLEKQIENVLQKNNIDYIYQYKPKWLGKQSLDFFIPTLNTAIECQGIQHFEPVSFFGGYNGLKKIIERDLEKNKKCKKNNIKILYFSNKKYKNNIITDEKQLLNEIKYK